jgi:hypothetical protein
MRSNSKRIRELADRGIVDEVHLSGIERGQIDSKKLTPLIASLPLDLARHELMMTMEPVPDSVIAEILYEIFLPLVMRDGGSRSDPDGPA